MRLLACALIGLLLIPVMVIVLTAMSPESSLTVVRKSPSIRWIDATLADRRLMTGLGNSLLVASGAVAGAVPLGWWLARMAVGRPGTGAQRVWFASALLPMGVPTAILALGWLMLASRLPFADSRLILTVAHISLGIPLVVIILIPSVRAVDPALALMAQSLGTSRCGAVWVAEWPGVRASVVAATVAVGLLSLNEAVVSVYLSRPGCETLPAVVWPSLRQNPSPKIAVVGLMQMGIVLGFLTIIRIVRLVGRGVRYWRDHSETRLR